MNFRFKKKFYANAYIIILIIKRMKSIVPFLLFATIIFSCSRYKNDLERALTLSGDNRTELEKVLNYYSNNEEDNLKYKAACFLIENMPYHYYYEGELLDKYSQIYESMMLTKNADSVINSFANKYGTFSLSRLNKKEDIKSINSDYLISNIEHAFKVWEEQPWGKNISFDDFCMYILPYRVNNEQPLEWRSYLYEKYNPLLDSLKNSNDASDPLAAARIVINSLCKEDKFFTTSASHIPLKTPLLLDNHRAASCREMADLTVYILRSLGIPCGIDFLPLHGRGNEGHCWTFILNKDGDSFSSDYLDCSIIPAPENLHFTSKIYRETFCINKTLRNELSNYKKSLVPFFNNPRFIDITEFYCKEKSHTIHIPEDNCYYNSKGSIVYLCGSRYRDWHPVDWSIVDNAGISFDKIKLDYYFDRDTLMFSLSDKSLKLLPDVINEHMEDMVFRLANQDNGKLKYLTDPFILKPDNTIQYIKPAEDKKNTIYIYSKYNILSDNFVHHMPGGIFEASNDINFKTTDTLFTIEDIPFRLLNIKDLNTDKKYRYIRYKGANNTNCGISEIQIYSDTTLLKGIPFGNNYDNLNHDFSKAFDGDPYTSYYDSNPSGGWVGLDISKQYKISKIIFVPRNRDNFIRINDRYELFNLSQDGWNSSGIQLAESDSLIFENIPSNTLLYLKNHTRGVQERIFLYKNDIQVFL